MLETDEIQGLRSTLRRLERALNYQLSEQGSCCNVTMEQCHTILELGKAKKKVNLKTLADQLGLDKSTVSRGIDSLVKIGLVIRKPDDENRRNIAISLSDMGQFTCNEINENSDSYYKNIFKKIPEEKHRQVIESLAYFVDAMQLVEKDSPKDCAEECNKVTKGD